MKPLLLSIFSFLHCPIHAENKLLVEKVTAPADPTGVVYSLPKSIVGVDVTLKKTTRKPGKFAEFTNKFFALTADDDYPVKDSTAFTTGAVTLKTRQIADPAKLYRVKLTKEWMKDHHFNLELAEDGTLTKGEVTITNKRVDFFLSIIGTVASIAGKFVGVAALSKEDKAKLTPAQECAATIEEFAVDPKGAAAAVKAKPKVAPAFCEIVKLIQYRQNILSGKNTLVDGTSTLLNEIDLEIKKRLSENFIGSTKESTWTARFEHIPTGVGPIPLFDYDSKCGFIKPAANWIDAQVGDGFDATACKEKGVIHSLKANYAIHPNGSLHSSFNDNKPAEHSFAFTIPAAVQAIVMDCYIPNNPQQQSMPQRDDLVKADITIAQLGVTGYMPAVVGGKKSSVTVTLHASGALKSVDINVEAQGNIAETAGGAASSLADGILARRKAAQDASDEVNVAERKQKLLEAEVAARRAQCILDGLCPLNPQ